MLTSWKITDYGLLTAISGNRIAPEETHNLSRALQALAAETGMTHAEIILRWAYDKLHGILVTSTSNAERADSIVKLLDEERKPLPDSLYSSIEQAAEADGYDGKVFYGHPHIENAAKQAS